MVSLDNAKYVNLYLKKMLQARTGIGRWLYCVIYENCSKKIFIHKNLRIDWKRIV